MSVPFNPHELNGMWQVDMERCERELERRRLINPIGDDLRDRIQAESPARRFLAPARHLLTSARHALTGKHDTATPATEAAATRTP